MVLIGGAVLVIISMVLWQFSVASNATDNVFSTLLDYAPWAMMSMGIVMLGGGALSWAMNKR